MHRATRRDGDESWRHVLDTHDDAVDHAVAAHRGHLIKKRSDRILATSMPSASVSCAEAIRDSAAERGVLVRSGCTGEIESRERDVASIALQIANRVAGLARIGEILVSRTVVDLADESNITFDPRGDHQLRGVPREWSIIAAS